MRETLILLHPGLPLPPITKKGKTDDKHLIKRMYLLEKFLNRLMTMPEIRADEVFQKFLRVIIARNLCKLISKFEITISSTDS